ncbi:hypothetical protein [Candidatus Binatus sp.]|uniref:hypothetical protein n=1 Tax=Candidatus Binatus sp. TaxID=2811406 RepID=UPI003CC594B5
MKSILKSSALLISLVLLVIVGFALTSHVLTRQPTTPAIEPTPQTLQPTAQALPPIAQASHLTAQPAQPIARAAQATAPQRVASAESSIPGAQVLSTPMPLVGGVYRIGVNLDQQDLGGPKDFMQNMLDNPGFEPPTDGHLIKMGSASNSTFTDATDSGAPTGYWVGAKASVRTGAAAGDQFTIVGFTAGGSYAFGSCQNASGGSIACPTLAAGVGVAEVLTSPAIGGPLNKNVIAGWAAGDTNSSLSTADKFEGQGSLSINVADGNSHYVDYGWDVEVSHNGVCSNDDVTPCTDANQTADCGSGNTCVVAPQAGPWHPVKGPFEIAFWAKGSGTSTGTPQVTVALTRPTTFTVSHTFTLTNDGAWHQYTFPFTGGDTGFKGGSNMWRLDFKLTATNGSAATRATIYIDDIYLGRAENSLTGFRDEVVQTLRSINPGSLRYGAYVQLGTSDDGYEGASGCRAGNSGPTATGTCDYLHGPSYVNGLGGSWVYAAQDAYALDGALDAVPFMTIGNAMNDADLKEFTDRLCTATNTYNFPSVWIENENEEWLNGHGHISYGSENLGKLGYGEETQRNFSIMNAEATAHCPSIASRFHYIMGNQICNSGVIGGELAGASAAGYPMPNTSQYGTDDATYYPSTQVLPSYSGSLASQAAQYALLIFGNVPKSVGPPGTGCINNGRYSDYGVIGSNNFLAIYEMGPGAGGNGHGNAAPEQAYLSEGGYPSAAWMAESWLLAQQIGKTPIQNEYQLGQLEYQNAPMWGIVHDLDSDFGPTFPHLRPIALGMEVMNSAIGGNYYPVSGMPSGTYANAFLQGSDWSAILVNSTSSNSAGTITFPTGTVPGICKGVLYSNGITDNNENSNSVYVGPCASFSCSGQICSYNLPPFSVEAMDPSSTATSMSHRLSPAHRQSD